MGNFYTEKRWRSKRKYILKRDGYQCRECKRYGQVKEANTVHHIYPRNQYPGIAYASWNLISVSSAGHEALHHRQTGEMTEKGLLWQRKRKREFTEAMGYPPHWLK